MAPQTIPQCTDDTKVRASLSWPTALPITVCPRTEQELIFNKAGVHPFEVGSMKEDQFLECNMLYSKPGEA